MAVATPAEVGPVDDDVDEHDVEVLSEEPEYDTTRADRPPPPRFFAPAAVRMCHAAVNVVALKVLCIAIAIGTVGLVHVSLRLSENDDPWWTALQKANVSLVDCGGYICRPHVASVLGLSGCITFDATSAASAACRLRFR